MKLRDKIVVVLVITLLLSGGIITAIWYHASNRLTSIYLTNVSESSMKDAYHAFEYLLTDTSYMATMIAENEKNIKEPVTELNTKTIKNNAQWNETYLKNRRIIMEYINGIDGYKYYISGITIMIDSDCFFSANHAIRQDVNLYDNILKLDQNKLQKSVLMMEPMHMEGMKSAESSDYVVPAVRAIMSSDGKIIGYVIVYFDYSVIDRIFSANLPKDSFFSVVNDQKHIIYANSDHVIPDTDKNYVTNKFYAENVGWMFQISIPSQYYVAGIQKTTILTSIIIVMIITGAVLILTFWVTRLTKEITELRNKMDEVSTGNLAVQYRIKSRDEIGQMGEAFNQMVGKISGLMKQVTLEEQQKRQAEMAFLQAQINPHFISNVLNNVVWMAKIQHAVNIVPLVNSLNYLLRAVMHEDHELICLKQELEYVENYLNIMEYSGSYDFIVDRQIEKETLELHIPRFILQPIVENALYHGMPSDLSRQEKIIIGAKLEIDSLRIWIEDNGEGMSREEITNILSKEKRDKKSFNGIGVANVNERIKLCFGSQYGIRYESEKGRFTRCVFLLPIVRKENTNGED